MEQPRADLRAETAGRELQRSRVAGASSAMNRLVRRLVTIPCYVALFLLSLGLLPVLLPLAAGFDLVSRTRFGLSRALLFFTWYLGCETAGLMAAGGLWLARPALSRERWSTLHQRLKCIWARTIMAGARAIFRLRFEIEGAGCTAPGPVLLFVRHASVADTLLAATFVESRQPVSLRYVLKRELLWDPCIDVVGNRLPNCFVDRFSSDSAREIAAVTALARNLGPDDGVLIYPEGTRFTEAKRTRVLERLRKNDVALHKHAAAMQHVLPPRLGGPLALLDARPDADVVFCAHAGFEGITRFSEFLGGGLVHQTIRVGFWRVPASDIPRDPDARVEWLLAQWSRVDTWVAAHLKH